MLLKLHSETNSKERKLQWQGIMGVHGCNNFLEKKMIAFSCGRWWCSYCMHSCPLCFLHSLWASCLSALRWTWMHEECFSVTYDSSIVLTWNIAAECQGTGKDWKQLFRCGEAIVPVTTWFKIQLSTKNTLYIKSIPPVCLVKRRLAPVNCHCFSL